MISVWYLHDLQGGSYSVEGRNLTLTKGGDVEITIEIKDPEIESDYSQFHEWLSYELGYSGLIKMDNPLSGERLEITDITY